MVSLSVFDAMIAQGSLLKHPFYVRWSKGELTLDDLRVYAQEYYHLVRRIPEVVETVLGKTDNPALRANIAENLREEREHIALWERFAKSLGLDIVNLRNHKPCAATVNAVAMLERAAKQGLEEGMATIYALERELPAIAQAKKEGLMKFYGLSSEDAHAYFDEHMNEEKHLEVWRAKPVNETPARSAVSTSLSAQHKLLDAVCELRGIPVCDCAMAR